MKNVLRLSVVCLAMTIWQNSFAQSGIDSVDDKDQFSESNAVQLPAPPLDEDLLPFDVVSSSTQSFAIDAKSLTVANGVVHYTLVSRSREGARNVSYEGIRCASFEKKLYAFGRSDGSWSRSRRDDWQPISGYVANRHHAVLATDYFCEGPVIAGTASDIVERLRQKKTLSSRR